MGYTKKELLSRVEIAAMDMSLFYKEKFVNYRGKTIDTHEYYSEVISEWLLNNSSKLDEIVQITRGKSYAVGTHDGVIKNPDSPRREELIAMELFTQGDVSGVGKIIDYQTPLKSVQGDKAGKVDVLSYDGSVVRILELKKPTSDETMLRCVLEGYTYLKTLDKEKMLRDFNLPSDSVVVANPLVFKDGMQHEEMKEGRPYLEKLIDVLGCPPLYITKKDDEYVIREV